MTRLRPLIVITVTALVAVTGWAIFEELATAGPAPRTATPAATAPPIRADAVAPHPDFGHCTRCHDVLPTKGKTPRTDGLVPVASAPPIPEGAALTHPDWGPCQRCHAMLKPAGARTAAATTQAQPLLGVRLQELSATDAERLDMEGAKGLLVTEVLDGTPAADGGLKVDDVVLRANDVDVASIADLRTVLGAGRDASKVKLQISRGERKKNIFIRLTPAAKLAAATTPAAPMAGRVAIAATSADGTAQVAPIFSGAPYFLLRDGPTSRWVAYANPNPNGLERGKNATGMLTDLGVSAVIAGNVGPGAFASLQRAGVQVYSGAFGDVEAVYAAFLKNRLSAATATILPAAAPPVAKRAVAVAAMGPTLDSPVCPSLAASPYFILLDLTTGTISVTTNPVFGRGLPGSVELAQFLVDRGAVALVAGNTDAQTVQTLGQLGITSLLGVGGRVEDAMEMYLRQALPGVARPDWMRLPF